MKNMYITDALRRLAHPVTGIAMMMISGGAHQALASAGSGTSLSQVWDQLTSDPYEKPHNKVTLGSFFGFGVSYIQQAANRTLSSRADLLPRFTKLVHPNGVCLKGEWSIDTESPYTGYFAKGSRALIISRASAALSDTERGTYRAFGLAGKIYPTLNPNDQVETANFFVIDDLGGQKSEHYLDVALTNEPKTSLRPSSTLLAPVASAIALAFSKADINPNIRQTYEVAELGLTPGTPAHSPKWMQITASEGQPRIDALDFRDEFVPSLYPSGEISFDIAVASTLLPNGAKDWRTIGKIVFTDAVISDSCDHRLHFHHPKFRKDLSE